MWQMAGVLVGTPSSFAVLFESTDDPAYNTTAPRGGLANSGWQYEGQWNGFLGTPIAPMFFLAAKHVGGTIGDVFVLNGFSYHTVAFSDCPTCDLRVWQVAETFPLYAPLYTTSNEVGRRCVVFGRGTQRGAAVIVNNQLKGWNWGTSDGVERWGQNIVSLVYTDPKVGELLQVHFDRQGITNECQLSVGDSSGAMFIQDGTIWKLAGINYSVDGPFSLDGTADTQFEAALLDMGGLYVSGVTNWTFIPVQPFDLPSSFYSTRVSANLGWINSAITTAPVAPVASFEATPAFGSWPMAVTFTDTSTGTVTNRFWSFGDGSTATTGANILTHTYLVPGTNTVILTVSGLAGSSTDTQINAVVVSPPIVAPPAMHITKLQAVLNFAKANADSCTVKGALPLSAVYSFAGKQVTLDVGGAQVSFALDGTGSGLNGLNVFTRPTYNKKTGQWTFSVRLKGSLQAPWANYGLVNSTVPKPGVLVTNFPVILVVDTEAFLGTANLHYTATAGRSGTAK